MPLLSAWINVENISHTIVGDGPITNFTSFRIKRRMNRAGEFRMTIPASDQRAADLLQAERFVQCYAIVNGTKQWIGGGIIRQHRIRKSGNNAPMLEISGPDLMGELTHETVGDITLEGSGAANLTTLLGKLPAGWTSGTTGTAGAFNARFVHDTPLNALIQVADKLDAIFRVEESGGAIRNLEWYSTLPTTPVVTLSAHATADEVDDNTNVALITDIQDLTESTQLVNTAYFYGAGNGEARIGGHQVDDGTHVWPDDSSTLDSGNYSGAYGTSFDWDDTNKCIKETVSVAANGTRSQAVQFSEVGIIANTDTSFDDNMDTLIKQTVRWLERRCEVNRTIDVQCVGLQADVLPGDVVTVDARFYRDGEAPIIINNEDFTALEVETLIDADGVRVSSMMLAERRRWPNTDGEMIASNGARAAVYASNPQFFASIDTTTYRESIDANTYATLHFWMAEETSFVNGCILRFRTVPLSSMLGYLSGGVSNVAYVNYAVANLTLATNTTGLSVVGKTGQTSSESPTDPHDHNLDHDHSTSESAHGHTLTEPNSGNGHLHTIPWGLIQAAGGATYAYDDLEFRVNGAGSWITSASVSAISGATGWYELDMTSLIRNSLTLRPSAGFNYVEVRADSGANPGDSCQIVAQIQCRTTVQALSSY